MTEFPYPSGTERRQYLAVRKIFAEACALLTPVIEDGNKTLGVSSILMMHVVQDHYPQLSLTEVHVMVTAIERLHHAGRLHEVKS